MYGAVLRPSTELVDAGAAHMGALFLTHEGYSTMCGHATIALSRLLVDCDDPTIFPRRHELHFDQGTRTVELRLHLPCGLVRVSVPAIQTGDTSSSFRTDTSRPITYLSVPSFATAISIPIPVPPSLRWPELSSSSVTASVAFGGAFYLVVPAANLGFPADALSSSRPPITALRHAAINLKAAFTQSAELCAAHLRHPHSPDLQFLYSVFVTEAGRGEVLDGCDGAETGLCVFADGQVDRSPTGSGVQARVALAVAKGERRVGREEGQRWVYHSLLSNAFAGKGGFVGRAVEEVDIGGGDGGDGEKIKGVRVEVSGWANYTGVNTFVVEEGDEVGAGFSFEALGS